MSSAAFDGTRKAGMSTVVTGCRCGCWLAGQWPCGGASAGRGARGVRGASQMMPSCSATPAGRCSAALAGMDAPWSSAGISVQVPSAP